MKLGTFGLLRLLVRAIATHSAHQASIASELRLLNRHIARIYPTADLTLKASIPEPDLGGGDFSLGLAEDARDQLRQESHREPSDEEVLERLTFWADRAQAARR